MSGRGNTEIMEEKNKVCPACEKHTHRTEEEKKALTNRLNRIEGQIRGIRNMLERDAYCNDVLIQCSAVSSALSAFERELLRRHVRTCVVRDIKEGKEDVVDELLATLEKLM